MGERPVQAEQKETVSESDRGCRAGFVRSSRIVGRHDKSDGGGEKDFGGMR
jgi:hypothetical protein